MRKTFDIPILPNQSCAGARRAYFAEWQREWPHDDDYLRQLANEVPNDSEPGFSRCNFLLQRMRENHVFETEGS